MGYYKVSNIGNIYSVRSNKNLKLNQKKNGYIYIELNIKGNAKCHRVHRLVAGAFIPNIENKPYVNHINGIKNDNRVENLEWVTGSENNIHAIENNLVSFDRFIKSYYIVNDKKNIIKHIKSLKKLEKETGLSNSTLLLYIKKNKKLKTGKYQGYKVTRKIS